MSLWRGRHSTSSSSKISLKALPKAPRGPGPPSMAGSYRTEAVHKCAHIRTITPRVEQRLRPGTALRDQRIDYLKGIALPSRSTRAPPACCSSTCPRAATRAGSLRKIWMQLPGNQIPGHATLWASGVLQSCSPRTLAISANIMLRFLRWVIETALHCSTSPQ